MKLIERAVYRGPHIFSATPMVRMMVDIGTFEDAPISSIDGFNERLLSLLPGLAAHGCCYRTPGGFIRRLEQGTWAGHVVEHVALELQTLAGTPVTRGKTRSVRGRPGVYNIMFAYRDEMLGLAAGEAALALVDGLAAELTGAKSERGTLHLEDTLAALRALARKSALGPTTASLVAEARRRRIPVERLNDQSLIRLGWGSAAKVIRASITGETSLIATETVADKHLTKTLLLKGGVAAPAGVVARSREEALAAAGKLKAPLVVKPVDGNHGRGVALGLQTAEEVAAAFDVAMKHSRRVIVEEQFSGQDYRILVVDRAVVAVAERTPAQVVGDGAATVAELIDALNADPRRGIGHEQVMTQVRVDGELKRLLEKEQLTLDSRPEPGRVVRLRDTANLSTGGTATDRTDVIHPDNEAMAIRAAAIVGLDVAGIDFITPDITRSVRELGGGVVEINAAPGFRMHLDPSEGRGRDVAGPVIRKLFPQGSGRIPVIAVTGTNGKSTTVRMVAHILEQPGLTVGQTSTAGVLIGRETVYRGDASGPKSARLVLADPTVDVAVLETARGGILREGLGFDRCDVGVVLNVAEDHLGIKGIDTVEDLAAVKSVVTEAVGRRGVSVLNADDPLTRRMARHAGGRIAYFSLSGGSMSPFLADHIARGGMAATAEGEGAGARLVLFDRGKRSELLLAREIPATFGGRAPFNIANALAATLIAHGVRMPIETIVRGLKTFSSSFEQSPGRLNVHDTHGFRVILDYAHNPAGLRALGQLIDRLRPEHNRVIGAVSIPGDRRDADIHQMGVLSARLFDDIVFREKPDGRGRAAGEVCRRLRDGALAAGFPPERVECIPGEAAAMAACLDRARPGDLVVLLPTDVDGVWAQVLGFAPDAPPFVEASSQAVRAHG